MNCITSIDPASISNIEDVRQFIKKCNLFFNGGFHPDTPFKDYLETNPEDNVPTKKTFSKKEAKKLEKVLDKCYVVCAANNNDLEQITYDIIIDGKG